MKSQDIFLLLKLVSLYRQENNARREHLDEEERFQGWEGWDVDEKDETLPRELKLLVPSAIAARYTARGLESETGISKSEVNNALNRCLKIGLAKFDRKTKLPRANQKALAEFIVYGLKYVFPAQVSELSRGIPTSFAAPVLKGKIMSAGESIYIWPDAHGSSKGQAVQPLYKSVPMAVKKDPFLYEYLSLVDAIRLGNAREVALAKDELNSRLRLS